MATEFQPFFPDSEGNEVHIGDLVSWVTSEHTRFGCVLEITYKPVDGVLTCKVKVKGRQQFISPECLTLVNKDTLEGKLRYLVTACDGRINEAQIAAAALEIEAMFEDDSEQSGEQAGEQDDGDEG